MTTVFVEQPLALPGSIKYTFEEQEDLRNTQHYKKEIELEIRHNKLQTN